MIVQLDDGTPTGPMWSAGYLVDSLRCEFKYPNDGRVMSIPLVMAVGGLGMRLRLRPARGAAFTRC